MPIRTNRGRGAVYRRLWGWPIRSSKHLIATIIVVGVLITVIGVVIPKIVGSGNSQSPPPQSDETFADGGSGTNSPTSSSLPPVSRLTTPLVVPTSAPAAPEALSAIKAWAAAWVNHPDGATIESWMEGLKPYTTDEFWPQLSTVDINNIPADQITGEPMPTQSFTGSVEANISTNGPTLTITAVLTDVGWRISQYNQAG